MKRKIITLILLFAAFSTFAQTVATVSGYVTNSSTGSPIASHAVYIYADSTMNPSGLFVYDVVYTDMLGYYVDNISLINPTSGFYTQGLVSTGTYDCNTVFKDTMLSFYPGYYNMTANFSICDSVTPPPSTCSAYFYTYADTSNMLMVDFYDYSSSTDTINSWAWDFGDGTTSNLTNPIHTYSAYGQYNVCLTITSTTGCSNTYCQMVSAEPVCNATYYYSAGFSNDLQFSYSNSGGVNTWLWDFGDGTTSNLPNPLHTFPSAGFYNVCLTVSDISLGTVLCSDTYCESVSVNVPTTPDYFCDADFNYTQTSPGTFSFTDYSFANEDGIDAIVSWSWDFGDGTTSNLQFPTHTYNLPGYYLAGLTIYTAEGCSSHLDMQVAADSLSYAGCHADFEVYIDYSQPFTYYFQEASLTEDPNQVITSNLWDFGDGTTSTVSSPVHTFTQGVYHICNTITTSIGCTSTYCENLVVDSACYMYVVATSIINETTVGAHNGSIALSVIGTAPFTFNWSNGMNGQSISGLSAGYYNVWVTDANTCQTWATFDILVNADSSNWNYNDTLFPNVIDTCFNFIPVSASIYSYSFTGTDTITITWIAYDITGALHGFATTMYLYDSTGYYTALLEISCDSAKSHLYKFYDKIYIRGKATGISTNDLAGENVSLFPNPVSDNLNILFTLPKPDAITIHILNVTGQVIQTENMSYGCGQKLLTLNTSSLANGIYFVQMISSGQSITRRFVK